MTIHLEQIINIYGRKLGFNKDDRLLCRGNKVVESFVTVVTSSRPLTNADDGATLVYSGAGAITLTVPAGLDTAFGCAIYQGGAGAVTVSGSGATVNNVSSFTKTSGQYAVLALVAVGTNTYVTSGSMA